MYDFASTIDTSPWWDATTLQVSPSLNEGLPRQHKLVDKSHDQALKTVSSNFD